MTDPISADLRRAAHRVADQQSARLRGVATSRQIIAQIDGLTSGAAGDRNAALTISWQGGTGIPVYGYADNYTPALGHWVLCSIVQNQIIVNHRIIGHA